MNPVDPWDGAPGRLAVARRRAARGLAEAVRGGGGVRVGDATVASLCLHLLRPDCPAEVAVLTGQDAGQVFYHRSRPREVLHLDVFHATGAVPHRLVARAVYGALRRRGRRRGLTGPDLVDACGRRGDGVDLQTATGGGRLTGGLTYGQKASLRAAHQSHVHLAMRVPEDDWTVVFTVVDAVERTILAQGLELRSPRRLVARDGGSRPLDMTPYTDRSDSLLLPAHRRQRQDGRQRAAAGRAVNGLGSPLCAGETDALLACLDRLEGEADPRLLERAMRRLTGEEDAGDLAAADRRLAQELLRDRWLERAGAGYRLTRQGRALLSVLKRRRRTIASLAPAAGTPRVRRGASAMAASRQSAASGWVTGGPDEGLWERVAVRPTLWAALRRQLRQGRDSGGLAPLRIKVRDLRGLKRPRPAACDICLLIDASASMAGERMEAARCLAYDLAGTGGDRVAVLTFQERRVDLRVDFTRSPRSITRCLEDIEAFGLTPLAAGLDRARAILERRRSRSLLLLITDGIPTVPQRTTNPLADALVAAEGLRARRIPFACIGLEPNRRYLQELVERGGGSLHVVRELEAERLIAIARQERRQLGG